MHMELVINPQNKHTKANGVMVNIPISIPSSAASACSTKFVLVPSKVSIPPNIEK